MHIFENRERFATRKSTILLWGPTSGFPKFTFWNCAHKITTLQSPESTWYFTVHPIKNILELAILKNSFCCKLSEIFHSIRILNLECLGLKMAKIQGSDGLIYLYIGKRKIAILNIDSILNNYFLGQMRFRSACYNKLKMGLHVEFGWEIAGGS
jgi:hypothetical protein